MNRYYKQAEGILKVLLRDQRLSLSEREQKEPYFPLLTSDVRVSTLHDLVYTPRSLSFTKLKSAIPEQGVHPLHMVQAQYQGRDKDGYMLFVTVSPG